jgi:glycosyltransferase involved in cell wall biosynthesis
MKSSLYAIERYLRAGQIAAARQFLDMNVMTFTETIDEITSNGQSIARFGDGELYLTLRPHLDLPFQKNSEELRSELGALLSNDVPGLITCIPPMLLIGSFWPHFWANEWRKLKPRLTASERYGNSMVTRPEYFRERGVAGVRDWQRVWKGKRVLVVTGRNSRFDLTPALFEGAGRITFIYSEAKNAYDRLPLVEAQISSSAHDIVLIALGPAGTVLAGRLARAGMHAIDIGHLGNSYRTIFKDDPVPERQHPYTLMLMSNDENERG